RVAAEHPKIPFIVGSDRGPVAPNLSVFESSVEQPAYLCGLVAGKMTKSHTVGAVGGKPVRSVNRLVNALRRGAKEADPMVRVKVGYINAWYDPAAAARVALSLIDSGADALFAERAGVSVIAGENRVLAFGNLVDSYNKAPEAVVTGTLWDMRP